jgi:tetratricopeptide (TPR) repeat protein
MDAPQAVGYAKVLMGLGKYAGGSLVEAREIFEEAIAVFQKINDCRDIAGSYVHLARTAYRQEDYIAAMHFLEESLSISKALNIGWTLGFVYEIMGLLQRRKGGNKHALGFFQESLRLSIEQENQQGIANCLGALAGLAVKEDQARRGARLFAAAASLRRKMGAKMSSSDRIEYENYLSMAQERLEQAVFEAEWSEGFSMTTEQIVKELEAWFEGMDVLPI